MSLNGDPPLLIPQSTGRSYPFAPIPGKYGYVVINGVTLNVARWAPKQSGSMLPVQNQASPVDGNGNVHAQDLPGVVHTFFTIFGVRDASSVGWWPTFGDTGNGVLGYSASYAYNVVFTVSEVGGECNIKGVSALEFTIKAWGTAIISNANGMGKLATYNPLTGFSVLTNK